VEVSLAVFATPPSGVLRQQLQWLHRISLVVQARLVNLKPELLHLAIKEPNQAHPVTLFE